MKKLRQVLLVILSFALILMGIGFLLPRNVYVERFIVIRSSPEIVYTQINTIKNWVKWAPWMESDSAMQLSFAGPETGINASVNWKSNNLNVGNGNVTIFYSLPFDSILVIMDYGKSGKSIGKFHFLKDSLYTKVIWSVATDLGMNPISRWFGLFSEQMIGPDLMKGLTKLREEVKTSNIYNGFEIIEYEVPAQCLISARDTCSPSTITLKLSKMYKRISQFLLINNLSPIGAPSAIFHSCTPQIFDIEACIPIAKQIEVPKGLYYNIRNQQKTLMIKYIGPYSTINKAYKALQTCMKDRSYRISGSPWEEYVTNPIMETDSISRHVNLYFPVNR